MKKILTLVVIAFLLYSCWPRFTTDTSREQEYEAENSYLHQPVWQQLLNKPNEVNQISAKLEKDNKTLLVEINENETVQGRWYVIASTYNHPGNDTFAYSFHSWTPEMLFPQSSFLTPIERHSHIWQVVPDEGTDPRAASFNVALNACVQVNVFAWADCRDLMMQYQWHAERGGLYNDPDVQSVMLNNSLGAYMAFSELDSKFYTNPTNSFGDPSFMFTSRTIGMWETIDLLNLNLPTTIVVASPEWVTFVENGYENTRLISYTAYVWTNYRVDTEGDLVRITMIETPRPKVDYMSESFVVHGIASPLVLQDVSNLLVSSGCEHARNYQTGTVVNCQ